MIRANLSVRHYHIFTLNIHNSKGRDLSYLTAMALAFAVQPTSVSVTKPHLPGSTLPPHEDRNFEKAPKVMPVVAGAFLGLKGLRATRRSRVPRAGAPPQPIWQTNRLTVEQLERQWLLSYEPQEIPESKEDFSQAVLRFLGGSVLMAVLAQASFLGRRAGSEVPPFSA